MTAPARVAAFHALRAIEEGRTDLPTALARSRQHLSDDRDRALTADIVTGTVRWQRACDHLAAHFANRPLTKVDRDILIVLRLSLYQLLHLTRVPASAVVDDAVNLAREARKPSASGFVNAVLRATLRQKHRLPLPSRPSDPADVDAAVAYLGITHSHPDWLVRRWLARYGFDAAERWVQFNNEPPALMLRVNRLRVTREGVQAGLASDGVETEPARFAPDALVVTQGNPLRGSQDGTFVVQDEASQLVAVAAGARPGEDVLDLCASPGGKTIAMAADMEDRGLLVATDVRAKRMRLLEQTIAASGATCVRIVQVPGRGDLPFSRPFDRVLVDAPCSGLGTVRRDPDIRWRRAESDLPSLADAQLTLLSRAAAVVRAGGHLVYATCSSEPEENEQVVERFLREHQDFTLVDLRPSGPAMLRPVLDSRGMLRTTPVDHGLEAFFAAVMVR